MPTAIRKPELTSYINKKKVEAVVGEILKDGTPDYISHPQDYKNYRDEANQADKERSDEVSKQYRMEDQTELTDEAASLVNFRNVNSFIQTLRSHGAKVKIYQDPQSPQTCGLYAIAPGREQLGYQFITSMQVPVMPEWGLLREEEHGCPDGEAAIGWRQVLVKLVLMKVFSEQALHKIFGEPVCTKRSVRYRRTLHAIRNGRYTDGQ
jgi:hypothetical protein